MDFSKKKQLLSLINNYRKESHIKYFEHKNTVGHLLVPGKFKTIKSKLWNDNVWLSNNTLPQTAITHLLDSYYQLPERPDLAFNSLWTSINSVYSKIAIENSIVRGTKIPGDAESIRIACKKIVSVLDHKISYSGTQFTIRYIIKDYLENFPLQTFNFLASFILKGSVIYDHYPNYISSQFKTFKNQERFQTIYEVINDSYGQSYKNIYTADITPSGVELKLNGEDEDQVKKNRVKSEGIIHNLAIFLKELAVKRSAYIEREEIKVQILDDEKYLEFIFQTTLYSIRNTTLHGNSSARLSSINANSTYLTTSTYTFLYGHLLLSLLLYISNEIDIQDLSINLENLNLWKNSL
jgi:hypothetical protein